MDSFHRADWLSLAQSVVTLLAIIGAFGVVFVQNRLESERTDKSARKDRIRERYRTSTYAAALIGNAVDATKDICAGVAKLMEKAPTMQQFLIETARVDDCADALAQGMHQSLPTEITRCMHTAWASVQQLSRALHKSQHVSDMRTDDLFKYCDTQLRKLEAALETVEGSRVKWENQLSTI